MMICKIAQHAGFIFIILQIIKIECSHLPGGNQTIQELCLSNKYIYSVEPNESLELRLTSNLYGEISKWHQKSKRRCRKEFKTNNPAAHFVIMLSNIKIPTCSQQKCHCNYLEISEPGYTERFCGQHTNETYFESKGDYLAIDIYHGLSMSFEVTLKFTVERNFYIYTGQSRRNHYSGHILETPFFPSSYQSDYIAEYTLQSFDLHDKVVLLFLDFLIAEESFIEVTGHNGSHPQVVYGNKFRPPIFVSETNQLHLKFNANNQPGWPGFKAAFYYIKDIDFHSLVPYTNCGGNKKGNGGYLSIEATENHGFYDCLWHIAPSFVMLSDTYFLTVSIVSIENIGARSNLEFREGLNSKSKLVKTVSCSSSDCSKNVTEITVPAKSGLYIRFNGYLSVNSSIKMLYSTYYTGNCSNKDFSCNERCLMLSLFCDGVPNCPNGQDELNCITSTDMTTEAISSTVTIKKISTNIVVETIFLVLGIFGMIITVAFLFLIFYRYKKPLHLSEEVAVESQIEEHIPGGLLSQVPSQRLFNDLLPSYEDFIRCTDRYPPLLYTRATKRHSEPAYNTNFLHTTSFCGEDSSMHSLSDTKSLDSSHSSTSTALQDSKPGCSFERDSFKDCYKKSLLGTKRCGLRRTISYDSKLNKILESYHLHLSITHSIQPYPNSSKYCSLPPNFKITHLKNSNVELVLHTDVPDVEWGPRKGTSSMTCHDSVSISSEIVAEVKSRCQSDPCRKINVHYSLYH